jgi:beta-N-acetylhexosaminidase
MIQDFLKRMTLREKVGQVFLLAFSGTRFSEAQQLLEQRAVGAAYLSNDNLPNVAEAARTTQTLRGFAASTRLGIPLLLGADQEGAWAVMVPESCPGPGNMALGAARDPALTHEMYKVIARELRAVGLNTLFAPCADCNSNPRNSIIGMRAFGERPELVSELVAAAVQGAQAGGVVATAKHFPGHGDTSLDSHRGLPSVTRNEQTLRALDLAPFASAVRAGVGMVMTAHILFSALDSEWPATLSKRILQQLLREELGFEGVILSDSMNMGGMKKHYAPATAAVQALNAGVDLIMLAEEHYDHDPANYLKSQLALLDAVESAVNNGVLSEARLDDAVERVLTLKARFGLFDAEPTAESVAVVGSSAHRDVELAAAKGAIAILRDEHRLIPVASDRELVLVNTTLRKSYEILASTRGIGPNQTVPAFDYFAAAMRDKRVNVRVIAAEDVFCETAGALADVSSSALIIAVTENYPLPGIDFEQQSQAPVVRKLLGRFAERLIVVALRDPYELLQFPEIPTYVCAFSFRPCAAQAAAAALCGEFVLAAVSPVSLPQ